METKILAVLSIVACFVFLNVPMSTSLSDPSKCCCSTVEVTECLEKMTKESDAKLNRVYRKLLSQREAEDQILNKGGLPGGAAAYSAKALKSAQKAWIKFRDLNCEFQHSLSYPGTGASLDYGSCIVRMTEDRAAELEKEIEKSRMEMSSPEPSSGTAKKSKEGL